MSGGGGAGPLGQVVNQAQQSTSLNNQSGTPVGQQPTRTQQPYSFGSQGFNLPQQQYQPGGGYGMNQSYGNPFGQQMGGYGSPFGGYGSPFGGYGSPFGGMGGYGMNQGYGSPFGGGYGSPFGGAYGINQGNGGMGGFNPYAQQPMRSGPGYGKPIRPGLNFDGGMFSTFEATPEQMGQPNPFSNTAIQNQQLEMLQGDARSAYAGQPVRGGPGYEQHTGGGFPAPGFGPGVNNFSMANVKPRNPAIGGLGGLASMMQGKPMFNKGGKVDE